MGYTIGIRRFRGVFWYYDSRSLVKEKLDYKDRIENFVTYFLESKG